MASMISGLLTTLAPLIKDELSLLWNFRDEVKKLSSTLSSIDAVFEDAETETVLDKQTEDWLRNLKHVAYEIRDTMDEWTFEDLRLQVKRLNASSSTRVQVTNYITLPFSNTWTRLKVGHKIKDVQKKLDQISSVRNNLRFPKSNSASNLASWRQTISTLSEKVYGRDSEKQEIVDILVNSSSVANEVSVLPILGLGGLGKTTLAQLVFNNEDVTKHFDVKFWVCVSEEFDITLIIKSIIGAIDETSLERLKDKIQDKLKGKRYLLVLDDVWNENDEQWKRLRSILNCGSMGAFILTTTRKKRVAEIMKTDKIFELSRMSDDDCWQLFEQRAFKHGTPKTPKFIHIGQEIAIKCKGVPLIAKTLGGQLGFQNDENEWCRIRDNEIWKIDQDEVSQNVEFILPILKLSYYDLSYHLRRCFTICATFSKDTEIEKERLIQLWMAHDLIPITKDRELEDTGSIIWGELMWRSFFQEEKLNLKGVLTCKMHDLMHDLAQSVMKDECYTMDARSSSMDFEREIRHLTIMIDEFEEQLLGSLKNIGGLQSMKIYSNSFGCVLPKEIFSVLKELSSLRVFEVPKRVTNLDLSCVRCFKHLKYLNLSGNKMIKILPNGICSLLNLQTLNLKSCLNIGSLPENLKDLINLRHLHLKGCEGLKYMPRGMGRIRNLKTLSLFPIGYKESDGQLDELKELDIRGYLEIRNLQRVTDASIAKGISMCKKSSINQLELYWNDYFYDNQQELYCDDYFNDNEKKTRHEKIGEALEVSTKSLKRLRMYGYKGVNMPKWVGESSASLVELRLEWMDNVQHILSMNNMNTSASEIGMVDQWFPLLEQLFVREMKHLRELVCPPIPITTTTGAGAGAFPNLWKLEIIDCPKLGALPWHLKSLKDVRVEGECCDELLDSIISYHGSLTHLSLRYINDRRVVLVGAAASTSSEDAVVLFPLLEQLHIKDMKNLRELASPLPPDPVTGAFPSLWKLYISNCPNLGALVSPLPPVPGAFPNLGSLEIIKCPKLRALPPHLKSLKDVSIKGECCDELLDSIISNSGLTHLTLKHINDRKVLVGAASTSSNDVVLFPLLEQLPIEDIMNLRGLVSPDTITTSSITISGCPSLGALPPPPCPKSLQDVEVVEECSNELLQSISKSNMRNPINLYSLDMDERSVLFPGGANINNNNDDDDEASPLLMMDEITSSSLAADNNIEAQAAAGPSTYNFQSLLSLRIYECWKLRSLFDEECEELAAGGGQREREIRKRGGGGGTLITNLSYLHIVNCPELLITVEQWRNLITPSLIDLWILGCPKLVPSSKEEAEQVTPILCSLLGRLGPERCRVDFLTDLIIGI